MDGVKVDHGANPPSNPTYNPPPPQYVNTTVLPGTTPPPNAPVFVINAPAPTAPPMPASTSVGNAPQRMICPQCQQEIVTKTENKNGSFIWIACVILTLFGCWLGCCLIPFCMTSCKDVEHRCPHCDGLIGRWNK